MSGGGSNEPMPDYLRKEQEVVQGLPADWLAAFAIANAKLKASGGCKGCGQVVVGCHKPGCPTLKDDLY